MDYLDDVDADFRAFYHIDLGLRGGNIHANLSGARFVALAQRVVHYPGVMRSRVEQEANTEYQEEQDRAARYAPYLQPGEKVQKVSPEQLVSSWSG